MSHSTPNDEACPVCGEPFERRLLVERGDDWGDLYPGSPLEFFRKFDRRCSADSDVAGEYEVGSDALVLYFHGSRTRLSLF
ncbi:hypothetical protein ACFO0N_02265 [Halobium salinum]|uniref:Uncharacterized protein n=1 Tax=Halobium salinum TaxID=1364940 RepID=A0ABD5P7U4_9EURY|nr:hypothetical protein [Halobium salinum]